MKPYVVGTCNECGGAKTQYCHIVGKTPINVLSHYRSYGLNNITIRKES